MRGNLNITGSPTCALLILKTTLSGTCSRFSVPLAERHTQTMLGSTVLYALLNLCDWVQADSLA